MSRVLVVTALDVEARGLARRLGLIRVVGTADLRYQGPGLDLACAGPRALHLARCTDLARTASLVVSAGTCGALAPDLAEGDLVVPERVLTREGRQLVLPRVPGLAATGTLLSVDRVAETAEAKARFRHATAALAVDMESASIVAWAQSLGIPVAVVRAVADPAHRAVPAPLVNVVDATGRTRGGRAAWAMLRQPSLVPRALALRRGTAAALRTVACAVRALAVASTSAEPALNELDVSRTGGAEGGVSSARSVGRFWVIPAALPRLVDECVERGRRKRHPPRQDPSASRPGRP